MMENVLAVLFIVGMFVGMVGWVFAPKIWDVAYVRLPSRSSSPIQQGFLFIPPGHTRLGRHRWQPQQWLNPETDEIEQIDGFNRLSDVWKAVYCLRCGRAGRQFAEHGFTIPSHTYVVKAPYEDTLEKALKQGGVVNCYHRMGN